MTPSQVNWFETWRWLLVNLLMVKIPRHLSLSRPTGIDFYVHQKLRYQLWLQCEMLGQEHPLKNLFIGLFHPHLISQNVQILSGILETGIWRILQAKKWYFTGHLSIPIGNSKCLGHRHCYQKNFQRNDPLKVHTIGGGKKHHINLQRSIKDNIHIENQIVLIKLQLL